MYDSGGKWQAAEVAAAARRGRQLTLMVAVVMLGLFSTESSSCGAWRLTMSTLALQPAWGTRRGTALLLACPRGQQWASSSYLEAQTFAHASVCMRLHTLKAPVLDAPSRPTTSTTTKRPPYPLT